MSDKKGCCASDDDKQCSCGGCCCCCCCHQTDVEDVANLMHAFADALEDHFGDS